ncbi:hypothetical protein ACEPAH_8860 [Sanghuangporus vaninii]
MSSNSPSTSSPWPAQTQLVPQPVPQMPPSHTAKRRRNPMDSRARFSRLARAEIANQTEIQEAQDRCFDSDNSVYSCWPTNETVIDQNDATQFVWNSRLPSFTQFNLVDIGLIRADTGEIVRTFENQSNPSNRAGSLPVVADDIWWASDGPRWDGEPTSFPFYFVVVATGTPIASGIPQSTFTAVQTTLPNSVLASMSSAVAASSAAEAASSLLSSISATLTGTQSVLSSSTGSPSSGGSIQDSSDDSSFPRWAIAVIVILGFLALAALVALIFLIVARARRRRYDASRRGSMGSQSPMMANVQSGGPLSPQVETSEAAGGLAAGAGAGLGGAAAARAASSNLPETDGASSISENLFSGADAAVMAEAFRKALRKPEFGGEPVEEGESPELTPDQPELLSRELAEEGRDIRSVGSSRGVRVETLSDGEGETATATRHSTPRNSTV